MLSTSELCLDAGDSQSWQAGVTHWWPGAWDRVAYGAVGRNPHGVIPAFPGLLTTKVAFER